MNFSLDQASLFLSVIGAAITTVAAIARLWIAPLKLELTALKAEVANLRREHEHESAALQTSLEKLDERYRRHTGDEDRHTSAERRVEFNRRLERIEHLLLELVQHK